MNERLNRWKEVVERLIDKEYWDHTTVGSVFRKKFKQWLADLNHINKPEAKQASQADTNSTLDVYVALHANQGNDINVWQGVLKAFPDCGHGRPVYADESQARRSVERKKNLVQEGYVVLQIAKHHVLKMPSDKLSYDAWGQPMLVLRPEAIKEGIVTHFIHANQRKYAWQGHALQQEQQIECKTD